MCAFFFGCPTKDDFWGFSSFALLDGERGEDKGGRGDGGTVP